MYRVYRELRKKLLRKEPEEIFYALAMAVISGNHGVGNCVYHIMHLTATPLPTRFLMPYDFIAVESKL